MSSIARFVAPPAVLLLGVAAAVIFVKTGSKAERKPAPILPSRVEVTELPKTDQEAEVSALGTVVPAEQVSLIPEVSGLVRHVSRSLVPGGIVRKDELLLRIDPRNYRLAVDERRAQVAKAEFDLQLERGRVRVAEREWELLEATTRGDADEGLALRRPHLLNAEAALSAAKSALSRAQLDLERTTLRAPFDAVVQSESAAVGQIVGPGSAVAALVGTSHFWVQTSLPLADLALIELPDQSGAGGSRAQVEQELGTGGVVAREGRVVRLLGDLDPAGKMARVLVEIPDPMGLSDERPPLLLGAVVRVRIEGQKVPGVYVVPRRALHEDRKLWLERDGRLAIRPVEVVWRGQADVFVRGDIGDPARLILSRLKTPVDGMAVRVEPSKAARGAE